MMNISFTLQITGAEHEEWQGTIKSAEGKPVAFRSVIELLKGIQTEVEKEK